MEDEGDYVKRVVQTLKNYQEDIINKNSYMQKTLSKSSIKHKTLLLEAGLGQYLDSLLHCVEANQLVLNEILDFTDIEVNSDKKRTYKLDHDRLNDCLAQVVREWTTEGGTISILGIQTTRSGFEAR